MADYSKLEGRITIPTGGYTFQVRVGSPPGAYFDVIVAAGDYYLTSTTSLLTTWANAITNHASTAGTYTATLDDTENSGTGKVTIAQTGETSDAFEISWTGTGATSLRDLLGFTGTGTGALLNGASAQGAEQAEYLYLPNVKRTQPMAPDGAAGYAYGDGSFILSPSGKPKVLAYNTLYKDNLQFDYVLGSKAFIDYEAVINASWEKFWTTVVPAGFVFRYHKDRNVDGTYVTYVGMSAGDMNLSPMFDQMQQVWGASGAYRIQVPVVKKV